jgi:DNA primase
LCEEVNKKVFFLCVKIEAMSSDIDEIKNRLGIEEIVGEYIKLKKAGSGFTAPCPFHSEKTPSFHVSPDRGIYKCFGCGESGDIFSFVQKFEGLDFPEAKKKLAEKAGVILENFSKEKGEEYSLEKRKRERLLILLDQATKFFQKNLFLDEEAKNYLKKRGVDRETAEKFRLGLALDQ